MQRAINRCRTEIIGTHNQRAEALATLGKIAGVEAFRRQGQSATDTVWNWSGNRQVERRLWEVKTGDPDRLPRSWVEQSLGQLAEEESSSRTHVVGCILTHLEEIEVEAAKAARDYLCLVHIDAVCALIDLLGARLSSYSEHWGGTVGERGNSREFVEPLMPSGRWLDKLLSTSKGCLIRREDVNKIFPS